MSLYDAYEDSHTTFEDIVFIGGTDYKIEFPSYNYSGNPHPITSYAATWFLCPYGQPEVTITEIACSTKDDYTFTVTIPKNLSLSLSGAYTHQLEVTLSNGESLRVAQGTIVIKKGIPPYYYGR